MDDDLTMTQVLRLLFAEEGWRVSTSMRALDLDEIRLLAPDAIVLDLLFDHRPLGWERLRHLRRCPTLAGTPVVLCTAAPELAQQLLARSPLANLRVVDKPFDIDALIQTVREGLGGHAARPRARAWTPRPSHRAAPRARVAARR